MKKALYIAVVFFFFIPSICAMDLEAVTTKPKKSEKFLLVSEMHKVLLCELQRKVFGNIIDITIYEYEKTKECIDHQEIWQKLDVKFLSLQIGYAQKLQKICQDRIGGKKFLAHDLFFLPYQQQDVFIKIANHGFLEYLSEGDLSDDDYKILETMENENIKKGLTLRLLQGNKITSYTRSVSAGCGCLSFLLLLCSAIFFNTKDTYLFYLARFVARGGASLFGVCTLLEICGYPACIIKKQF